MVNTASVARGRDAWSRILAVAGALIILASLFGMNAARPAGVFAASISPVTKFQVSTTGPYVAGEPFGVTVTAQDKKSKTVTNFSGPLDFSGLAASPHGDGPTYPTLTWVNGVGTGTAIARKAGSSAVTVAATADPTVGGTSPSFTVAAGDPAELLFEDAGNAFNGQPVDTKAGEPISSSLQSAVPVKVIAVDAFGNGVSGVSVAITSSGGTLTGGGGSVTGANGQASFGTLKIAQLGNYTLLAAATDVDGDESDSFEIVADLKLCNGASCDNKGTSTGNAVQLTYTNITAGGNAGSFNEDVVLTTTFLGNATECANQGTMIGETTEVRVQDAADQGVSESAPDFKVALIYPRATLQFLDVTSRGTPSFQVCLGATLLATPDTAQGVWLAKTTADGSTLAPASGPAGPTIGGTYWGWAPDCAAVSGRDENPCIVVRTKDASVLASALGISANDVKQLPYKSGDMAVVVSKPWPWDGKMGLK